MNNTTLLPKPMTLAQQRNAELKRQNAALREERTAAREKEIRNKLLSKPSVYYLTKEM